MNLQNIPQINLEQGLKNEEEYKNKLNELQEKLPSILEDFKKYYIFYNKNPSYNEYQSIFEGIKGNLTNIMSQLFIISNNVQVDTDKINKYLHKLHIAIEEEKIKNRKLKKQAGGLKEKYNSSDILINEYKDIYNMYYLRNFTIFLRIILITFLVTKIFKKK